MTAVTAVYEGLPHETYAPTDEESWEQLMRGSPGKPRKVQTETDRASGEVYNLLRPSFGCEGIDEEPILYAQPAHNVTAPQLGFERFKRLALLKAGVGDAEMSTICHREPEGSTSSTTWRDTLRSIRTEIDVVFGAAAEEVFEDAVDSEFSTRLILLIRQFGNRALDVVSTVILSGQAKAEVIAEALGTLGRMEDLKSRDARLRLLGRSLTCSSPWIRDGATLGLAWIDDAAAATDLRTAIEKEPIDELRRNMEAVLTHLQRA